MITKSAPGWYRRLHAELIDAVAEEVLRRLAVKAAAGLHGGPANHRIERRPEMSDIKQTVAKAFDMIAGMVEAQARAYERKAAEYRYMAERHEQDGVALRAMAADVRAGIIHNNDALALALAPAAFTAGMGGREAVAEILDQEWQAPPATVA